MTATLNQRPGIALLFECSLVMAAFATLATVLLR